MVVSSQFHMKLFSYLLRWGSLEELRSVQSVLELHLQSGGFWLTKSEALWFSCCRKKQILGLGRIGFIDLALDQHSNTNIGPCLECWDREWEWTINSVAFSFMLLNWLSWKPNPTLIRILIPLFYLVYYVYPHSHPIPITILTYQMHP